ncbi:MAG: hypothetical protein AABZ06_09890 [Bdellovibrionota bacterium]
MVVFDSVKLAPFEPVVHPLGKETVTFFDLLLVPQVAVTVLLPVQDQRVVNVIPLPVAGVPPPLHDTRFPCPDGLVVTVNVIFSQSTAVSLSDVTDATSTT